MIKSFVDQAGAPLLTIRQSCVGNASEITVAQSRLLIAADTSSEPRTWTLPACFKTSDGKARCEVIERPTQVAKANTCDSVFANADARGYYFSEYPPESVRALGKRANALTRVERLSLVGDEWWMVRSLRHSVAVFLDLAAELAADDTPALLSALQTRIAYIASNIVDTAQQERVSAVDPRSIRPRAGHARHARYPARSRRRAGPASDFDDAACCQRRRRGGAAARAGAGVSLPCRPGVGQRIAGANGAADRGDLRRSRAATIGTSPSSPHHSHSRRSTTATSTHSAGLPIARWCRRR